MAEREEPEDEGEVALADAQAALGAARLPAGLSGEWPVPRMAALGSRGGFFAGLEYAAFRGVTAALGRLPEGAQRALVGVTARVARRLDRRHSDAARSFLSQAFGPSIDPKELEARVLQAWRHFFGLAISGAAFSRRVPTESIRDHYDVHISDPVREVLARKTGCVVLTAHVGDWEAGGAMLPWVGFDPLYAVAKPPRNRPLSAYIQRIREARGMRIVPRRGAMRHAPAIIAAGGSLVLLLDQRARTKPVLAPFFGRPARCDRSAGVLLRRLGCPIVFGACYLTERPFHYRLEFPAVIWPEEVAGRSPEEIARRINGVFEVMIRAHPEQYMWLHDRYRGAPTGPFDSTQEAV